MNTRIRDTLVARGTRIFAESHRRSVPFTGNADADRLLNDLEGHSHLFVLAALMDRQIRADRAWIIPFTIGQRIRDVSMRGFARLRPGTIRRHMTNPHPLHRFPDEMARTFHEGVQRIVRQYDGDASHIWAKKPSSAEVVYRFLQFRGARPKIATMATNILARDFKVPLRDYYSIDISADVHVRRVFARLGLTPGDATPDLVVYKARALYPEFPGLMDGPAWEIGRTWCHPREPKCGECYMEKLCPREIST